MKKKVIIGMSGGVDSSAAAAILKEKGYEVIGVTLNLWEETDNTDAKKVCDILNIKHCVLDFKKQFVEKVVDKFASEYYEGNTPNPCIYCNKYLKFEQLFKSAMEMHCDYIATGHYADIKYDKEKGRYLLKKSKADEKDQSYVLYNLTQEQLSKTIFPLCDFANKDEIRKIAQKYNLDVVNKKESQDICFIPNGKYTDFLTQYTKKESIEGDFVDINGNIMGRHKGIINYTIGQRRGLGLSVKKPVFVIDINKERNQVILGEEKYLYREELIANDLNWIMFDKLEGKMKVMAKTRYSAVPVKAEIEMINDNEVKVRFENQQKSITRGQAVVFYIDDFIVGGGTIK